MADDGTESFLSILDEMVKWLQSSPIGAEEMATLVDDAETGEAMTAAHMTTADWLKDKLYGRMGGAMSSAELVTELAGGDTANLEASEAVTALADILCICTAGTGIGTDATDPGLAGSKPITDWVPGLDETPDALARLTMIQMNNANITPATRDMKGLEIFLNAIPSIEMSRCVPYLDVKVMRPNVSPVDDEGRIQSISLLRFLDSTPVESGKVGYDMATAIPILDKLSEPVFDAEMGFWGSGMELFTVPQSMINSEELDLSSGNSAAGENRYAPVIDKFRPFMSLNGLDIRITPQAGAISYQDGTLSFTLHDRSRLGDIADLVRPDQYSKVELLIEYGWSHPDGGPESDNVYGRFLNSLRVREKFMPVNVSYSFNQVGAVDIKLSIAAKGVQQMNTLGIFDHVMAPKFQKIEELTRTIANMREKLYKKGMTEIRGSSILGTASDADASAMVTPEELKEINSFITKFNTDSNSSNSDMATLVEKLKELYGEGTDAATPVAGGAVGVLRNDLKTAVNAYLTAVHKTPDPWLPDTGAGHRVFNMENATLSADCDTRDAEDANRTYVSVGKLVSCFIGSPLSKKGDFDDVQIFFYNMNSRASFCANLNIAAIPIKWSDFKNWFGAYTQEFVGMNVSDFMGFMANAFFDQPSFEFYGFASMYEAAKAGKNDGPATAPSMRVKKDFTKDETSFMSAQTAILQTAYGASSSLEFTTPMIHFTVECLPVSNNVPGENSSDSASKTVLRIHISDQCATPYEGQRQLIRAATSNAMSSFVVDHSETEAATPDGSNTNTIDFLEFAESKLGIIETLPTENGKKIIKVLGSPSQIKNFIKSTMPSITYGSQNTAIKQANLTTINDPLLNSVHMIRTDLGDSAPETAPKTHGVPMRTLMAQLKLETFGCPLFAFLQQFFVDFGTGTTIDNSYGVNGVAHKITAGSFSTSIELIGNDVYGTFESFSDVLEQLTTESENT